MATTTQTEEDKGGNSLVGEATAEGVIMFRKDGLLHGAGTGTPNWEVTAPKGSTFIEKGGPDWFMNTDGVQAWEKVGTQS